MNIKERGQKQQEREGRKEAREGGREGGKGKTPGVTETKKWFLTFKYLKYKGKTKFLHVSNMCGLRGHIKRISVNSKNTNISIMTKNMNPERKFLETSM